MATTFAFPAAWGQLTATVTEARTVFSSGAPSIQYIRAEVRDGVGALRAHMLLSYDYNTGAVTDMVNGTLIETATSGQKTTMLNAGNLAASIVDSAISTAGAGNICHPIT